MLQQMPFLVTANDPEQMKFQINELLRILYEEQRQDLVDYADTKIVQSIYTSRSDIVTLSAVIPWDDTVPQSDEGVEVFSKSITPSDSGNILMIQADIQGGLSANYVTLALFKGDQTSAIAARFNREASSGVEGAMQLRHIMLAGATTKITFKVRAGVASGTSYINARNTGARVLGGAVSSTFLIQEYRA
jgi:hypothetical protein